MNALKPADRITAVCIGLVVLAAMFCFCLCRYLKIDYPQPDQVNVSCSLCADSDSEDKALFRIPYTGSKAGKSRIIDVRFEEAPWLCFTDAEPGTPKAEEELLDEYLNGDEDGETDEDARGAEKRQLPFFTKGVLYFYPDRGDQRFAGFMKAKEPVRLTTARVTYEDGTAQEIAIGRIDLIPQDKEKGKEERAKR